MTADPLPEAAPRHGYQHRVHGDDVAHPFSTYVQGVLTVHFDGGPAVTRDVSQFDARVFLAKQKDSEAATRSRGTRFVGSTGSAVEWCSPPSTPILIRPGPSRRRAAAVSKRRGVCCPNRARTWRRRLPRLLLGRARAKRRAALLDSRDGDASPGSAQRCRAHDVGSARTRLRGRAWRRPSDAGAPRRPRAGLDPG